MLTSLLTLTLTLPQSLSLSLTLTPAPTLTLKLGWHDTQVMPNPKPSMRDLSEHSVSVVAVVSERQAENDFGHN